MDTRPPGPVKPLHRGPTTPPLQQTDRLQHPGRGLPHARAAVPTGCTTRGQVGTTGLEGAVVGPAPAALMAVTVSW
jgi:hypothetical protein